MASLTCFCFFLTKNSGTLHSLVAVKIVNKLSRDPAHGTDQQLAAVFLHYLLKRLSRGCMHIPRLCSSCQHWSQGWTPRKEGKMKNINWERGQRCWMRLLVLFIRFALTLKVLNFWKLTSYCSLKPLWSGMGEVVPARTLPTLHTPFPPTMHQLLRLAL